MVDSLTQVYTLLDVQITCEGHQDFIEEIQAICDRNKNLHAQKKEDKRTEERQDPKMFAEHLQKYIENSIQNLPVRVYIENALGTLLNDGLYELAKHRNKESDVSHNTATNNIKWLIRYIIDHHFPKQPNN